MGIILYIEKFFLKTFLIIIILFSIFESSLIIYIHEILKGEQDKNGVFTFLRKSRDLHLLVAWWWSDRLVLQMFPGPID